MRQGSFNGVSGSFDEVSRVLKVSSLYQDTFKGVSRKIEGYLVGDFNGVQGYLKELQKKIQGGFKGNSRVF